jgi:hypothetical protein
VKLGRESFGVAGDERSAELGLVICATVLRLSDGRIAEQTVVQAWDEG